MTGGPPYEHLDLGDPVFVPLSKLTFGLSPRFQPVDPDHVRVLMDAPGELPPILVRASDHVVIDGVHRTTAARQAGRADIRAFLYDGEPDAAFALAVEANVRHGRPLSSRERTAAVRRLVEAQPDWSDRRLAELCGVSPATVSSVRRSSVESAHSNAKVGRDGRARPVDAAGQRRRIADRVTADPGLSLREVAAEIGCAPATVMDVRRRLASGLDPVPPKLRDNSEGDPHDRPGEERRWRPDASYCSALSESFATWFETTAVRDRDWQDFVDAIPLSRAYEVADEANARAQSWARFAAALNRRASRGSGG